MELVPHPFAPALASPSQTVRSRPITAGALALVLALVIGGASARPASADPAPQPSPYPVSWEFKFTHGTPKRLLVDVFGKGHTSAYWYMTYTVTNPGDQPIDYLPDFRMLAENGKVIKSDSAIPREVFDAVVRREGNKLLQTARKIEGPLNAGEDQAKDGVAIWPEPAPRMGSFSIFCAGLSGEYVKLKDKDGNVLMHKDPITNEEEPIILHKALQLMFHMVGEDVTAGEDEAHRKPSEWVMR